MSVAQIMLLSTVSMVTDFEGLPDMAPYHEGEAEVLLVSPSSGPI
jgi:hypothetical protein